MSEKKFYNVVDDFRLYVKDENGNKQVLNFPFVKFNLLENAKTLNWNVEDIVEYCLKYGKPEQMDYTREFNLKFAKSPEEALKMAIFPDEYDSDSGKYIRNLDFYKAEKVQDMFNKIKFDNGVYRYTEYLTIEGFNPLKPCQIEKYNKNEFYAFECEHEFQIFETTLVTENIFK